MPATANVWQTEFIVNTFTDGSQTDPQFLQLANGNWVIAWSDTSTSGAGGSASGSDIVAQIFNPMGVAIGANFRLNNSFLVDDERDVSLTATADGGFIAVFEDAEPAVSLRLNEFDATGAFVSSETVASDPGSGTAVPNIANPVISFSSATSALVVYESIVSATDTNIVFKIYNPTTNTFGAETSLIAFPGVNSGPEVVTLNNGNYVIAARNVDGAESSIAVRIISPTGVNVLSATKIGGTGTDTETDSDPSIAALTGGGFVVTWTNTDSNDTDILYQVFNDAGGTVFGPISTDNLSATNSNNESSVAALTDGGFVIVWDNDAADQLEAQRYNSSGAEVGGLITISTVGGGSITNPRVQGLDDGRFVVTWGDGTDIRAEVYDPRDSVNNPGVYQPDGWQVGTIGDDVFTADGTAEFIHGHTGNDTITANGGTKSYFGDAGADTIIVDSAINADSYDGGTGNDTIDWSAVNESNATFNLATGLAVDSVANDEVMTNFENLNGTANNDTIIGSSVGNILNGNAGSDTINGEGGSDTISGGDGNDVIQGGTGNDTMQGGAGADTLTYSAATAGVTVNLGILVAQNTVGAGTDTVSGFENLIGSGFNDQLQGDAVGNTLIGGLGNDTIIGNGGQDTASYITSAAGITMNLALQGLVQNTGGAGSDFLLSIENLFGSNSNDTLTGDALGNIITGNGGNDALDGGGGTDTVSYSTATAAVVVDLSLVGAQNTFGAGTDTLSNFENLTGSAFNDTLVGNSGNNSIQGGAGNDAINGGAGFDTASYSTASAAVTVSLALGGGGGGGIAQNTGGAGTDTLTGFENLIGSVFNDTLTGDGGANALIGGLGNDTINGGAGSDTASYAGNTAAVTVSLALQGVAQNTGGAGLDTLNSIENLLGSYTNDTLTGDGNNNIITGGVGADLLTGGGGADTFLYQTIGDSTAALRDTILDFTTAQNDKINIGSLFGPVMTFLGAGAFTGAAGEVRVFNSGGFQVVQINVTADLVAEAEIRVTSGTILAATDFVL